MTRSHGRPTEMNRLKTRSRASFRIIRANGKVEQHILIFDPAELHSLRVNTFIKLHPGDRLDDYFDLRDLRERTLKVNRRDVAQTPTRFRMRF
jgi:hypothetical protein